MKSIYVTSIEHFSGKTAVSLGLGKRFQADGFKTGYMKPVSVQPWRVGERQADGDASFVVSALGLERDPRELSPVVVTPTLLNDLLTGEPGKDLLGQVRQAYERLGQGQDVLVMEGGGSLREGYVFGLPTVVLARELGSSVLAIVKYEDDIRLLDDALSAKAQLDPYLTGILINRVPAQASAFVSHTAVPYLERHGVPVLGVLPEVRALAATTVGEVTEALGAEVLTKFYRPQAVIQNLTVGAMTAESALSRFRQYSQKAVITGGDRTDIQMAALETSTTCLVLTGNLPPSPLVVKQAEEFGVSILLTSGNTMETIAGIEKIFGKTRLNQPSKLRQFQSLLDSNVNFARLYQSLGL